MHAIQTTDILTIWTDNMKQDPIPLQTAFQLNRTALWFSPSWSGHLWKPFPQASRNFFYRLLLLSHQSCCEFRRTERETRGFKNLCRQHHWCKDRKGFKSQTDSLNAWSWSSLSPITLMVSANCWTSFWSWLLLIGRASGRTGGATFPSAATFITSRLTTLKDILYGMLTE